jgi:sulfur relay protein TusB/DsrH
MTVYLVDEPFLDIALAYASLDKDARIVLLQDAVYSAREGKFGGSVFVVEDDVSRRGLKSRLPSSVRIIGYPDLVRMMEEERVVNFL